MQNTRRRLLRLITPSAYTLSCAAMVGVLVLLHPSRVYAPPQPTLGDFDLDDDVDGIDFLMWQRHNTPLGGSPIEYAEWRVHFGYPTTSVPTHAVPEPTGALLAALALAPLAARRLTRRSRSASL